MPNVAIPNLGVVQFPDTMTPEEIDSTIRSKIMPTVPQAQPVTGTSGLAETLNQYNPFGGETSNRLVGSVAKGLQSTGNAYANYKISELMPLLARDQQKYGRNFENAPPEKQKELLSDQAKLNEYLTQSKQVEANAKAVDEKYGLDPLSKKLTDLQKTKAFQEADGFTQFKEIGGKLISNLSEVPEYIANLGLSSLPASIAMGVAAKFGGPMAGAQAGGLTSAFMEYGNNYAELREEGFSHTEAHDKAAVKSALVGIMDAASLKSAGKVADKIFGGSKQALKETAKDVGKETFKQAGLGAAGEGFGAYLSNQPVDPRSVIEEALGEVFTAPVDALSTYKGKRAEQEINKKDLEKQKEEENKPIVPTVKPSPSGALVSMEDLDLTEEEKSAALRQKASMQVAKFDNKELPLNGRNLNPLAKELGIEVPKGQKPEVTLAEIKKVIGYTPPTTDGTNVPSTTPNEPSKVIGTQSIIKDGKTQVKTTYADGSVTLDGEQIVPPIIQQTQKNLHTLEEIMDKGETVSSKQEAEKAHSDGDTLYGFHEQDETNPILIKNIDDLAAFTPDQILVMPKEEVSEEPKAPLATKKPNDPAIEAEALALADQIEALGQEGFAKSMRAAINNMGGFTTPEKLDFYKNKLTEFEQQAGKSTELPQEKIDLTRFLGESDPAIRQSDTKRYYQLLKEGSDEVKDVIRKANENIQKLTDKINSLGFKVDDVNTASPQELQNLQRRISQIGGSTLLYLRNVQHIEKGNKNANPDKTEQIKGTLETDFEGVNELLGETPSEETHGINIPTESKNEPLSAEAKAQQDLEDALNDLAWLASKPGRLNMMPEDEQKLLPILTRLMDAAFRLGYHKFKQAAKFVLDTIRSKFGKEAADKIKLNHLQGAYIGMSGNYPDKVSSNKEVVNVESLDELEEKQEQTTKTKDDINTPDGRYNIALYIADHLLELNSFKTIVEARNFIADIIGVKIEAGTPQAKLADEIIEVGVVMAAQQIAQNSKTYAEAYDKLVDLYDRQPNLNVRTSTSVREQAYSTPAPLAFLASKLAGITDNTTVYEPTAGNGMLLINANQSKVTANELNTNRFEMLKRMFPKAKVLFGNAINQKAPDVNVVIANPPFGSTGEDFNINGFNTRQIDHAISMQSLEGMKANGKAVLIVGGVLAESENGRKDGYRNAAKRNFYANLYDKYNVVDHFTVAGSLYLKQGASYPVDVIVIDGKGKSQRSLPAADLPQIYSSYEQLKEKLNASMVSTGDVSTSSPNSGESTNGGDRGNGLDRGTSGQDNVVGTEGTKPTGVSGQNVPTNGPSNGGQPKPTGSSSGTTQSKPKNESKPSDLEGSIPSGDKGEQSGSGTSTSGNESTGLGESSTSTGTPIKSGLKDRRGEETETGHQVTYPPHSQANAVGTLVPIAMAQSIDEALNKIEEQHGNIDEYVADSLQMELETVMKVFSAEQVDALALAINNAEQGKGFIIGDQTGIGKGRVVAGMIKYALIQGKVPIFMTEKPNLYSDMIRDLDAIGMSEELGLETENPKLLMTNSDEPVPYSIIRNINGTPIESNYTFKAPVKNDKKSGYPLRTLFQKFRNDDSLGQFKVIFTTYNQAQIKGENQEFLRHFANDGYLILDESHNAGGTTNSSAKSDDEPKGRAGFIRELVTNSFGSFFSSATYAKRPDVMDLYSTTDMRFAVDDITKLATAIKNGGIPMQQIVANMLTKVGQYIRRERTFAGVSYNTVETKVDHQTAENMATTMNSILNFSRARKKAVVELQKELDERGSRLSVSNEKTQIQKADFGSSMHNLIDQMLLALKAQESVKHAVESLKRGEQVVLTVSNTMGSFLKDYSEEMGLKKGDPISLSFKDLYLKYLEKQRNVTIKPPGAYKKEDYQIYRLTDEDLGPTLTAQYNQIKKFIETAGFGSAPISPIDYMHSELRKLGYATEEITGRTMVIGYDGDTPVLTNRSNSIKNRVETVRAFNDGRARVIILNQSGSTGISLHASKDFENTNKRHMIIVQAEKNIDTHMQMLGRVHRTGQIQPPSYSQMMANIPAEIRPAAVLLKKMASLNANTTASKKSSVTAEGTVDFMNDYGGQVAQEFLRDNPEVYEKLGGKAFITISENTEGASEEDIRKLTGYIPVLPIKEQAEIYADLIERYNELIERENSMGTNKLEAKAVDLGATTLSSVPITENKGESLFAQPANMEKVEVKRTVKPYSKEEVEELVKKNLGNHASENASYILRQLLNDKFKEFFDKRIDDLKTEETEAIKLDKILNDLKRTQQHIDAVLRTYKFGMPISVKNNQGVFVYGVITNMEAKGKTKNPAAGSDWKMTIALANGDTKSITINFSQISNGYELREENIINWLNPETGVAENIYLKDLFDKGSKVRTEKRWMVTGNILAGYSAVGNIGQIMSYTKSDGTTGQGVLMPRIYDFEKAQRDAPVKFKTGEDVLSFMMQTKGTVGTEDKLLQIRYVNGRKFVFTVPKGKSGKPFSQDQRIIRMLGNDFTSVGSVMMVETWSEQDAQKVFNYLISEKGTSLFALTELQKAREMFAPKVVSLENRSFDQNNVINNTSMDNVEFVPGETVKAFRKRVREEQVKTYQRDRQRQAHILKQVREGKMGLDFQRELVELNERISDYEKYEQKNQPKNLTPEEFLARAARSLASTTNPYKRDEISKETYDVIDWVYKNAPALLSGIQLSIKNSKGTGVLGNFTPLQRIITLYTGKGAQDPVTLRHELTHSLEQMMTNLQRVALYKIWFNALQKEYKKENGPRETEYFKKIKEFLDNPSEETMMAARDACPTVELYQFLNPSEYWAVNAEKLFAAKMGTPWHRFVMFAKKLFEGMKAVLGFNNEHAMYKIFDQLIKGETPRNHHNSIVDLVFTRGEHLRFLENIQVTQNVINKYGIKGTPDKTSRTNVDKFLGGVQEGKDTVAKLADNPRLAANNMVGDVERGVLAFRVHNADFTAALTDADNKRYMGALEDSQGRAVASVAMNTALKASKIATQVIIQGKLAFNPVSQVFYATQDKHSMGNVLKLVHELKQELGKTLAVDTIQSYLMAKRSKSINQEYVDREANLENYRTEQMDPATPPNRQLDLIRLIEDAEMDLKSIGIALEKVTMTEEQIENLIALEKVHPQLKEIMANINAVNRNMVDMMEFSRIISKDRAKTLRGIQDYVPWQRIMPDQNDPRVVTYGSKGIRNVSREKRFKEGKVDLEVDNIIDNMLHNVMTLTTNSIKNYAANRIAQEYGTRNDKGKLKVFPAEDFSKGIVKILVNGRKINIQISDPLIAQSVIGIEQIQIPMSAIVGFAANTLRRTITFSPTFQVRQVIMDAATAALVGGVKNPAALFGGVFASVYHGFTQDDPIIKLLKSHGIGGYHAGGTDQYQYNKEIGLLNNNMVSKISNMLDHISDVSDYAQRRAIYVRVMKETNGDERAAIMAASNIINWDKRGSGATAQWLNRNIAFMNAFAQQVDVLTQALAFNPRGGLSGLSREIAMKRLAVAAGMLSMTCLMYAMAIGDDDEYNKLDDQTKMRNFFIPKRLMQHIGYNHAMLFPMHTSASYLFKSIPEMLYNKITKEGTKNAIDGRRLRAALGEGFLDAMMGPLASGPIPTAFKPFAELGLNHNFFTGGSVTPKSLEGLEKKYQYNLNTSELGKILSAGTQIPYTGKEDANGKVVEGTKHRLLSPVQADHLMKGLFGSVAASSMWMSNLLSSHRVGPEEKSNPLYGSFIAPDVARGREDLFYDLRQEADTAYKTYGHIMKSDQAAGRKYFEANKELIKAHGYTNAVGQQLQDINSQLNRIAENKKLNEKEKREQINYLKGKKEDILNNVIKFRKAAGF